jgi:hypothetical protein
MDVEIKINDGGEVTIDDDDDDKDENNVAEEGIFDLEVNDLNQNRIKRARTDSITVNEMADKVCFEDTGKCRRFTLFR